MKIAILALLLGGCTFYGTPMQIEHWPKLELVEHMVSHAEMIAACDKYRPFGSVQGCAIYYEKQCHAWATEKAVMAIERDNCRGLVHPYWRERAIQIRDKINVLREDRKE